MHVRPLSANMETPVGRSTDIRPVAGGHIAPPRPLRGSPMRTITLEEHITTPDFLAALAKAGSPDMAGRAMEAVRDKLLDMGNGRPADMDAAGIDMQVLSLAGGGMDRLDAATATAVARDTNDRMADAVRGRASAR